MTKELVRGDSYGIRRPLFQYVLTKPNLQPFPLEGCTIRTTYKALLTTPDADPTDTTAAIRHYMVIDANGTVTASSGLVLGEMDANGEFVSRPATAGKFVHRLTASETLVLPRETPLQGDVRVIDANGESTTFFFEEVLTARDSYTNRTTD